MPAVVCIVVWSVICVFYRETWTSILTSTSRVSSVRCSRPRSTGCVKFPVCVCQREISACSVCVCMCVSSFLLESALVLLEMITEGLFYTHDARTLWVSIQWRRSSVFVVQYSHRMRLLFRLVFFFFFCIYSVHTNTWKHALAPSRL